MDAMIDSQEYNEMAAPLRAEVAAMLNMIWPETLCPHKPTHPPEFSARSFLCRIDGTLAGYAAVIRKEIRHAGALFRFGGLSCVAVLPEYRTMGFGKQIVHTASQWIEQQYTLDFGIFTCQPELAPFYQNAGGWDIKPELILIGNSSPDALNSRSLKLAVLQRIFSARAIAHEHSLTRGIIDLNFPDGEFL